jgi:hypothetical protein
MSLLPALHRGSAGSTDWWQELTPTSSRGTSGPAACDAEADDDIAGRLMVASRAFRRWSHEHQAEFTHLFGSPIPGVFGPDTYTPEGFDPNNPAHAAGIRFGAIFMRL